MKKTFAFILLIPLALLFTNCQTFSPIPQVREFHKEMDLEKNSIIHFENLQGDLEIIGWKKNKIEINVEKTGTNSQLRQTDIEVKKEEKNIYIRTYFPRGDIRRVFVDYELHVPENILFEEIKIEKGNLSSIQIYGELKASIQEGNVEIEDFSGACNVRTEEGYITARIFENRTGDDLSFYAYNGDIQLYLPSKPNAQIKAETRQGDISSDFIPDEKKKESLKTLDEIFGKGEAKINLKTWSGKIKIKKIQ
jgi:DUF4097 and DUF4098 domain-containing protein YvlB